MPLQVAPVQPPPASIDLSAYLQAARRGRWVYERRELTASKAGQPTVEYSRTITSQRLVEGSLVERGFLPIEQYIAGIPAPTTQPGDSRVAAPLQGGIGILFRLADPMEPIPADLRMDTPIVSTTEIRYFDRFGRPGNHGELTRTAALEGIESIDGPAGCFEDCARIRVRLDVSFTWGPVLEWTSYIWLSKEAGEVRRVDSMSGWFWIFWFSSSCQFDLVSWEPASESALAGDVPQWTGGAVLFRRGIPHPEIAGMLVEYRQPVE